jgi:hypothetical protein
MKIENRVLRAIDAGIAKNFDEGLHFICPAVEATAQKHLKKKKVGRYEYKEFVRQYNWLLEPFVGAGLNLDDSIFPSIAHPGEDRIIESPDLADIVYHLYRCTLAHGGELGIDFGLIESEGEGHHAWIFKNDGSIFRAPSGVLWALIALVLFAKANKDIITSSNHFLTWGGGPPVPEGKYYTFDVDVFWGAEETVRAFFTKLEFLRITIDSRGSGATRERT